MGELQTNLKSSVRFADLLNFRVVAETQNLRQASEQLGISQPSITRLIKRLEKLFDAHLIERKSHGIHLTEIGCLVAQHAHVIKQDLHRLSHEIQSIQTGDKGHLNIGFFASLTTDAIETATNRLRKN
jgi:DNA-binding transcriptional LysR family regulator